MVFVAMLMLSGYSWKAHFVTLLRPYAVLLSWLADARHAGPRGVVGTLTALSFALCTLTSDLLGPAGANYAEAPGLIAAGALAAAAGVLCIRRHLRSAASSEPP